MSEGLTVYEPPYIEIAELLRDGKVIPFLGAGVSFGARQPEDTFDERVPKVLPRGDELSRALAKRCSFPSADDHIRTDLARVASYFADAVGPDVLRSRLHNIFDHDYLTCDIHDYLAEVERKLLIVTTNYDDLIERAFKRAGKAYDVVYYPNDSHDMAGSVFIQRHGSPKPEPVQFNSLNIDFDNTNVIYKMHGTVARGHSEFDSYVISEDHYSEFLSRMADQKAIPQQILAWFRGKHFLFLGYGLRDWNFRVLLRRLLKKLDKPAGDDAAGSDEESNEDQVTSWAIQFRPPPDEVELWRSRHVKIFDMDINAFSRRLREAAPTPASPTLATTGGAAMPAPGGPTEEGCHDAGA